MSWVAFDRLEPIGTRTTPDLLALLIAMFHNVYSGKDVRAWLPQDVFDDPLLPRRMSAAAETERTATVAFDYRRLRAERLKRAEAERLEQGANMAPEHVGEVA